MTTHLHPRFFRERLMAALLLMLMLTVLLVGCSRETPSYVTPLPSNAVVLVIGDSLVAGTGAGSGESWPDELARRTGWQVVNAGTPGHTSADARQRLDALLQRHAPDAVIIAVGGNDFLRNAPLTETRANLAAMIDIARDASDHVALLGVPEVSMSRALIGRLADHALFAELAREHELVLIDSAIAEVLSRAELRADRIHANAAGYSLLGQRVAEALQEYGWLTR